MRSETSASEVERVEKTGGSPAGRLAAGPLFFCADGVTSSSQVNIKSSNTFKIIKAVIRNEKTSLTSLSISVAQPHRHNAFTMLIER